MSHAQFADDWIAVMSLDLAFWKSATGVPADLYELAAEGYDETFLSSESVVKFREELLETWPDLADMVEPLEHDPESGEQGDLSRYLILTASFSMVDRFDMIIGFAKSYGLCGYNPQTREAIS